MGDDYDLDGGMDIITKKNRHQYFVNRNKKKRTSPPDFEKAAAANRHVRFMQLKLINDSYLKRLKHSSKRDPDRQRINMMLDYIAQQMLACANQPENEDSTRSSSTSSSSSTPSITRYQIPRVITLDELSNSEDDDDSLLHVVATGELKST
ncbi:MAG: hypothetical protein SGBAC_003943 [Bacillariaceae sp.]